MNSEKDTEINIDTQESSAKKPRSARRVSPDTERVIRQESNGRSQKFTFVDAEKAEQQPSEPAAEKPPRKTASKTAGSDTAAKKTAAPKTAQTSPKPRASSRKKAEETAPAPVKQEITAEKLVEEKLSQKVQAEETAPVQNRKRKFQQPDMSRATRYSPDLKTGLSSEQVEQRRADFLVNETNAKYTKSYKSIILGNLCTFFNLLCIVVAALLMSVKAYSDCLFLIIILANITLGIIQEIKAKKTIEKLSLLTSPTANVIRDGLSLEVPVKDIVLDDVIQLSIGKQVPTDCILAEGTAEVNESLLTGESVSVKKNAGDLLYAGSFISSGSCKVRAEKVGRDNYIETLTAQAKKYKKPRSELLNSLRLIITVIGVLIIPVATGMAITNYKVTDGDIVKTIVKTATVIVGMIPAGMFLLTTMALAVGVIRLSKHHTLVQELYSLEMLARVDVLCLDKTGTITDGRMKVNDCLLLNNKTNHTINEIMGSMLSALNDNNQTSLALYNHFGHNNALKAQNILPFSSKRKLSAVTFQEAGTFIMGAPEFVLNSTGEKLERMINQYASMGMRVLILAHSPGSITGEKLPGGVKPIALITLTDNIREDAVNTIKWFKENDVEIKVISGDNPVTVSEVARRVGIVNADKYVSLENLNDKEVESIATKYTVFGRVSPEQKSILIKALKSAGRTVAMTGDGVNDILAMKEADCSVAIAAGSEAARNVAHLVLMDSNFSSMPKVVNEGRRVINNIQKSSSLFLMKTLFTTIFAIIAIAMQTEYPFKTTQMLLLETCVIGIPSFFLALQANSNRVQGKFINFVLSRSMPGAFVMVFNVVVLLLLQRFALDIPQEKYETMAMIALTLGGLVMLIRLCQPFNAYRGILCAAMVAVVLTMISVAHGFFKIVSIAELGWSYVLILVCLIQFDFPLAKGLNTVADKIKLTKST